MLYICVYTHTCMHSNETKCMHKNMNRHKKFSSFSPSSLSLTHTHTPISKCTHQFSIAVTKISSSPAQVTWVLSFSLQYNRFMRQILKKQVRKSRLVPLKSRYSQKMCFVVEHLYFQVFSAVCVGISVIFMLSEHAGQLFLWCYLSIVCVYVYIYMCVCVCVCV